MYLSNTTLFDGRDICSETCSCTLCSNSIYTSTIKQMCVIISYSNKLRHRPVCYNSYINLWILPEQSHQVLTAFNLKPQGKMFTLIKKTINDAFRDVVYRFTKAFSAFKMPQISTVKPKCMAVPASIFTEPITLRSIICRSLVPSFSQIGKQA